jgi:serine/threonine protein phosphatase 1
MNWQDFVDAIENDDGKAIQTALWGRSRVSHDVDSGVSGIDRIFFGHTPQADGARRLGNCYYIDTGAVFRLVQDEPAFHLTCADIMAGTGTFKQGRRNSMGVDIKQNVPSGPFGKYAS